MRTKFDKLSFVLKVVNIHAAKTNLSRLIEEAANGTPFVIAKAGKPMVKVSAIDKTESVGHRLGFMTGKIHVPDDFDTLGEKTIERLFGGKV